VNFSASKTSLMLEEPDASPRDVVTSRLAGVVWQAHGLTVVPTLRWRTKDDYDNVASGIRAGGVVAVATYGSRRDDELRSEFERGLAVMVGRLNPSAVQAQ
jgi:hypothetical protein